ncbi:DNA-methyltransferase [Pseudoalteromonas phenolica]|uniref:DNA-methyltransferase n=1 Tax=Pseudoalteromonas phenolica TaxID=161398 RepID=UPI0038508EB9
MAQSFFQAIGVVNDAKSLKRLSVSVGIKVEELKYYDEEHMLPSSDTFYKLSRHLPVERNKVAMKMGIFTAEIREWLSMNADDFDVGMQTAFGVDEKKPDFSTSLGKLYHASCLEVLPQLPSDTYDLIFADPPFNLKKNYNEKSKDDLLAHEYEVWCQKWLDECIRLLKPGGSLFLWNIPKNNQKLSQYISQFLTFRHWIAVKMNYGFPVIGKLYPSHYSLLYFTKGNKPKAFKPDRLPLETCPKCAHELKSYGGYKSKLNPNGLNMQDVWLDINPVRHKKYKNRKHNELPISLLDRIIEMSTEPGDLVLDPFGGSGTTFVVSELKGRRWVGCEIGEIDTATGRLSNIEEEWEVLSKQRDSLNSLFPDSVRQKRLKGSLWVDTNSKKTKVS